MSDKALSATLNSTEVATLIEATKDTVKKWVAVVCICRHFPAGSYQISLEQKGLLNPGLAITICPCWHKPQRQLRLLLIPTPDEIIDPYCLRADIDLSNRIAMTGCWLEWGWVTSFHFVVS